ncbi:MAG TPA: ATP-binding protein [Brevundimonas sp.]|jgi:PAS domain S-box-containing protein|uniref:ATP-binding protein n=1 Tax=Brevundimonas sp. TaxID=1871086 RepID=UPI002E0DB68B|nr:ATP-binding protein [Brevundimonas sp.]
MSLDPDFRSDAASFLSGSDTAEAEMAAFFEVSVDMLCVRDLDGRMHTLSRSWETTLDIPVAELLRTPLITLIHPEDVEPTRRVMATANGGGQVAGFINRYRRRDGSYRHFEWWARRRGDLVYGVARDVTDRLRLEAERDAALAAAEAASRAKSDFLANVSHEVRTPLNGVIGIIDALSRTDLTPHQAELVSLVASSGAQLEAMVADLLDVARIEAGRLELTPRPFRPAEVLAPVLEIFRHRAEARGLTFTTRLEGLDAVRRGDGARIAQVLTNLLSNAVKFTEQGHVSVEVLADGDELQLVVADTGVGFDAAAAGFLFQRFSQADASILRRFGGTGLGLSICRAVVDLMAGSITADARPGEGARFEVRVPLPPAEAAIAGPQPPDPAGAMLAGRRVLLAEDHPVNQRVVQLILDSQGVELTIVDDGAAALAALETGRFDLVLMDMQMPGMDGLTATRRIRAQEAASGGPRLPVVMLSANAMAEHQAAAREAGADLHLPKPITAAPLLAGLQTALGL